MPRGLSPTKIGVPILPPIPHPGNVDPYKWVSQLYVELEIYFNRVNDQLVDNRGFLQVVTQAVANGFTVVPEASYVDLISTAPVTSSSTAAVAVGVAGQAIVISNIGGSTITLKHGAKTQFTPAADKVLAPMTCIFLRWGLMGDHWMEIASL